jgi:hypothetical protein
MYFKVKITKGLPQAKTGGFTGNNLNKQVISFGGADMNAASRHLENTRYLKQVPRDEANLEAEKGETAFGDINGDGFPEHMLIGGKRHSEGGTPLNLPDGTFIFSDTASMKIKDPAILAKFGKKKGSYTPAELAKPYDLNVYRKILEDPNSDKVDKKSAELMIKNINLKLGALALAQESKKGFPQGIPEVARPYMEEMGIREKDLMPQKIQPEAQVNEQAMQNPYENQGMGMQSPEEEMMEQGQGMQNPQEEMMEVPPMAQYGIQLGDYNSTANYPGDQLYKTGGSLERYQSKGEVKQKVYTVENLPKDAIIRDRVTTDTQPGDFIKQADGTYKKITGAALNRIATANTNSLGIPVEEFKKQSPENAKLIADANSIIEQGIKDKTISVDKNNNIKITGKWTGSFKDRVLLSRALNATNAKGTFGTDKYKIISQGATGPYSKLNEKTGKLKDSGSFVAGFTPELYEQRFIYEQAKGLGMTDDEAFAEVDRIQKNDKLKAQARRQFASTLGIKDIPKDDAALLSTDFYKKNYADVTRGIEKTLGEGSYRPAIGNELLAGFEHFDALGFKPEYQYENETPIVADETKADEIVAQEETPEIPYQGTPEWWKQDKVNLGLAAADYFDVDKALPWAARYEPQLLSPTFYDPTRELAAQSEQANIANQALAQFTGPQALSARSASIQGQGAKQAADTLSRYNNLNVGVANQFEGNNAQIANEAQRFNQAQNKQLYDQNVIANQQFKNTKRALRHNLGEAYNTGTTNMMKTDALNQLYPQYSVDPSTGGRMHYTRGKQYKPELASSFDSLVQKYMGPPYYMEGADAIKAAKTASGYSGTTDGVDPDMIGKIYSKKGGPVELGYVMGSNVFPFMFY